MERIFRMQKMLDRLEKEGRLHEARPEDLELMKKLDGKKGTDYNWQSVVRGENLVWIALDEECGGAYVAMCDCE